MDKKVKKNVSDIVISNPEKQIDELLKNCDDYIIETNKCKECIEKSKKALEIAKSIKDKKKIIHITYKIAERYRKIDKIDEAIKYYSIVINSESTEYETLVNSYINCAFLKSKKSEYDESLKLYFEVLTITQSKDDKFESAHIYSNIASTYANKGDYTTSDEYYLKAYDLYKVMDNLKLMKITNSNIATNHYFRGDFQKALELKLTGIPFFQNENILTHLSKDLNTVAVIYNKLGNLEKAIEYSLKSLEIKEKLNDNFSISVTLMNLGVFYHELGNIKKSQNYYHKSLKIKKLLGDKQGIASILNNFGNISLEKGEFTNALEYFKKSLSIRIKLRNKTNLITSYENIGFTYSEGFNDFSKALNYLQKALDLTVKLKNTYSQTCMQIDIAGILLKMDDLSKAVKYIVKSEEYVKSHNNNNLKMQFYSLKTELNKKQKNFKKALEYHIKYSEVKEKIFNEDSSKKIAEMQTKYETERKEKEAEIYRLKTIELAEKNKQIEKQKNELQKTLNDLEKSEIKFNVIAEDFQKNVGLELKGECEAVKNIINLINVVGKSNNTNVLIMGESGTGKEIVARKIHQCSNRKSSNFYAVNSSAIPEALFESQFFGHEKNAFTGADKVHIGWFEIADKGTLFLDEIGTMQLDRQVKLLRVIEEKKVTRLGSHKEIPVNSRIICATNVNLNELVEHKKFREDLYHRLSTFVIQLPPLRERKEDIPILLEHFVKLFSNILNKKIKKIEKTISKALCNYNFPGNVRELKNIVERAVIISDSSTLKLKHFIIPQSNNKITPEIIPLQEMEKQLIIKALQATNYHINHAAELLKVERRVVSRKMQKYNLSKKKI